MFTGRRQEPSSSDARGLWLHAEKSVPPATGSRGGTIFMQPEMVVGPRAQRDSWLLALHEALLS